MKTVIPGCRLRHSAALGLPSGLPAVIRLDCFYYGGASFESQNGRPLLIRAN